MSLFLLKNNLCMRHVTHAGRMGGIHHIINDMDVGDLSHITNMSLRMSMTCRISVLADLSIWSPRNLFIFTISTFNFQDQSIQKTFYLFLQTKELITKTNVVHKRSTYCTCFCVFSNHAQYCIVKEIAHTKQKQR